MATRRPWFLERFMPHAPDLVGLAETSIDAVMGSGPLDPKVKNLILLALDIAAGSETGTEGVAGRCRAIGATDEEIADIVRVVYLHAGLGRLAVAAHAFPAAP